ncbi:MAG: ABC transporter permease subunit [Alphaproteobacteria bacterium]|nr:ABC transporter permease subunit [Alphaproteobacteria bacterium]
MRRFITHASARDRVIQIALVLAVAGVLGFFWSNASENLARRSITFGFGFLWQTAGFDIPFRILEWKVTDTYGRALWVSFLNTVLVSVLTIVTATLLGLALGIMRLSGNWLVRNISLALIELVRNTPQLIQIVFWYVAVLRTLPGPRQSIELATGVFLNIRGLFLPSFGLSVVGWSALWIALAALVLLPFVWRRRVGRLPLAPLLAAVPLAAAAVGYTAIESVDLPRLQGFNFRGGVVVPPELVALWAGLSIYAAAFIAEIVRGSIEGIGRGQYEAARAMALTPSQTLMLIILPQAIRIMIPPLTSQYLNLIKSSSLGAAIAYPELVQIFAGTVLNQSGRAIEVMTLVMVIFLIINLLMSAFMNWYNRKVALVER